MTEADILALTYNDTCTVYRPFKGILTSGETVFNNGLNGAIKYVDIPCALSTKSGGKIAKTKMTASVSTEYILFTRPEIDIQPNDYIVIVHLNKKIVTIAGLADRLLSHNNVPLKLEKETV